MNANEGELNLKEANLRFASMPWQASLFLPYWRLFAFIRG